MIVRVARQSPDGLHVLCGGCKTIVLCARVWLDRTRPGFYLVWDEGWYLNGDHIERSDGAWLRPIKGYPPTRRPFLTKTDRMALSRALPTFPSALCACGVMNTINPKRLRVLGIAPHS